MLQIKPPYKYLTFGSDTHMTKQKYWFSISFIFLKKLLNSDLSPEMPLLITKFRDFEFEVYLSNEISPITKHFSQGKSRVYLSNDLSPFITISS